MNDRHHVPLQTYLFLGLAIGAFLAVVYAGGCNTVTGISRDWRGAVEGMRAVHEANDIEQRAVGTQP
jgi:hypothetical protein